MEPDSNMDIQKTVNCKEVSVIIDIPSNGQSSPTSLSSSSSPSSLSSSSSSSSSSSYDTDSSSVISKTYCSKHQEYLYMEKPTKTKNANLLSTSTSTSSSLTLQANSRHDNDGFVYINKVNRTKDWPIFIILISIIEIIVFMYDVASLKSNLYSSLVSSASTLKLQDVQMTIAADSVLIYRPDRRLEIWRFISYMFLHANWFHLGFNVVIQLFYGIPLEMMHGSLRIAIIYFAGVFSGSLGTSVVDSEVYLVGASGGVYALLAAHLANTILNYAKGKYAIAQLISVIIFVLCDLAYAFYTQYSIIDEERETPPVSYVAHLTGGLAGLTMGILVLRTFQHRTYEYHIWWLSLGIYCAFTAFAIIFNLINSMTAQLMEEKSEAITQHLLHDLGVS